MNVDLVTDGSTYMLYINGSPYEIVEPNTARLILDLAGVHYAEITFDDFPDEL